MNATAISTALRSPTAPYVRAVLPATSAPVPKVAGAVGVAVAVGVVVAVAVVVGVVVAVVVVVGVAVAPATGACDTAMSNVSPAITGCGSTMATGACPCGHRPKLATRTAPCTANETPMKNARLTLSL